MFSLHFHIERWKKREDLGVLVSTDGRVKDIHTKKVIKQCVTNSGYYSVSIKGKNHKVHRLVAQTYLGDITNMTIDHLDGNRRNNKLSNLEIVSMEENLKRAGDNYVMLDEDTIMQSVKDNGLTMQEVLLALKEYKKAAGIPACQVNKRIIAATVEEFCRIAKQRGVNIPTGADKKTVMDRIKIKASMGCTYLGMKLRMEDNYIVGYIN